MSSQDLTAILRKHGLRITDCRLSTLNYLLSSDRAVSARTLEDEFPQFDRVTLYRTISSFVDKGILHAIPDDSGIARYGICHDTCGPETHVHDHIHFKCNNCGNIECLEESVHFPLRLEGYKVASVEIIVNGLCKACYA